MNDFPTPGTTLVYNTFSGAFVELDAATLAAFQKLEAGEALTADEAEAIDEDYLDENVGVLVESREIEEQAYRRWYEKVRLGRNVFSAIVSTTFACNLDCSYCCQADVLDGRTMKPHTAMDVARWLAERATSEGVRAIKLTFVGGEPLLHPDRIESIVHEVKARVDIPVEFGLITNGVFLTNQLVDRWVPLGLTDAQITLDGDETTHAITRRSKKNAPDSFPTIFKNVVDVSRKIRIFLNGNYQKDTVHGFAPLLQKMREANVALKSVSFTPALQALGAPESSGSGSCHWNGSQPEHMFALHDEILRAGYGSTPMGEIGPCGFHVRTLVAIDPEGNIYKCPGFLGKTEWAVGHVSTGLNARWKQLTELDVQQPCGSCSHRPECAGGCLADQFIKQGVPEGISCDKEFFEEHSSTWLKRRYAFATTGSVDEAYAQHPALRPVGPAAQIDSKRRSPALRVLAA